MDEEQVQGIIDSLFPVGKERWIKVKYVDQDKSKEAFWHPMDEEMAKPFVEKCGYRITSISIKDEYDPQISALVDLKGEIIRFLYERVPERELQQINDMFRHRIETLKKEYENHEQS